MIPNVTRGGKTHGVLVYLVGKGKREEHTDPHLVAGSPEAVRMAEGRLLERGDAVALARFLDEPRAQFGTRHDHDAHLAEILVAARVIAVHVRVDEEADAAVGDLLDSCHDLVGERSELRIDHEHAIGSGKHANPSARSFQRVQVAGDFCRLDLRLAEIRRLSGDPRRGQNYRGRHDWAHQFMEAGLRACAHG